MADLVPFAFVALVSMAIALLVVQLTIQHRRTVRLKRKLSRLNKAFYAKFQQVREMSKRIAELEHDLRNVKHLAQNKLYRESLEDKQAQVVQAALQIKLAEQSLAVARQVLEVGKVQ